MFENAVSKHWGSTNPPAILSQPFAVQKIQIDTYLPPQGHWPDINKSREEHETIVNNLNEKIKEHNIIQGLPLRGEQNKYLPKNTVTNVEELFLKNIAPQYDAICITGSEDSTLDDTLPYLSPLLELIRICAKHNYPIYGICFGAQAIARAMYGLQIMSRMKWPEYGCRKIFVTNEKDPFVTIMLDGIVTKPYFLQTEVHGDCFLASAVPNCCVTQDEPNVGQAFMVPDTKLFGVQFHPEFVWWDDLKQYYEEHVQEHGQNAIRHDTEVKNPDPFIGEQMCRNFMQFVKQTAK